MMNLVLLLQATQDSNGVFHGRLAHHDRLEPTLKCRILLDVLAVLVECGCTNGMQLTTCERRLEHIARIHR